jgi:hypothetical protein
MHETHFATPPPPLQKLQTQQNRDTHRWTNRISTHIIIIFTIDFVSLYSHKKGIKGIPNPKQKGGEQSGEGGLPTKIPPPGHQGDHLFRTHPPGDPFCSTALNLLVSSSSRFHSISINQFKSNRDGVTYPAQFNRSITVTNRVILWNICRIYM